MLRGEHRSDVQALLAIGEVVEIQGRKVKVQVSRRKNGAILMYSGAPLRNVAVGSHVKLVKGFSRIIGVVEGESAAVDRYANSDYLRSGDNFCRILNVSIVGSLEGNSFVPGVKELPLVGSMCYLPTEDERAVSLKTGGPDGLPFGCLTSDPSQLITLHPGNLLASHVGIFGNTGSGKSYTLAKILSEALGRYGSSPSFAANSRFLLIDFNGEYISDGVIAPGSLRSSYQLDTRSPLGKNKIPLPFSLLCEAKVWQVFLDATEKTQAPFLVRTFRRKWVKRIAEGTADDITAIISETVIASLSSTERLVERNTAKNFLYEIMNYVDGPSRDSIQQLLIKVASISYNSSTASYYFKDPDGKVHYSNQPDWESQLKIRLEIPSFKVACAPGDLKSVGAAIALCYYDEIIKGYSNVEHLSPLVKRLNSRIAELNKVVAPSNTDSLLSKPLTVISLRDVNIEMRKIIPMLVCSHVYEEMKVAKTYKYLNIVVDEAHNILSEESSRESEQWKSHRLETFEEIIKEGRKYGVFLTLASQRPHDISPTIISQLHNYFIHRLMNEKDLQAIEKAVSYIDRLSFDSIPVLATGSCVVSGVAFSRPLVVDVSPIEKAGAPTSNTINVEDLWS